MADEHRPQASEREASGVPRPEATPRHEHSSEGIVAKPPGRWLTGFFSRSAPAPNLGRPAAPPENDSLREVVETIVFVVVLVLLLRSFLAEAFVIPTGSMATTLLGYHRDVTCPQCHYQFPVNASKEADPDEPTPLQLIGCTCPNCRLPIQFEVRKGEREP